MELRKIDINCDVGEGVNNEHLLFPLISSCNIACGGHAGNLETMKKVAMLAEEHNVKIGAHPSYPDKENFGRTVMDIPDKELKESIVKQLTDFINILVGENLRLHHIKPHGALYNQIAKNRKLALVFLEAIEDYRAEAMLYAPFGSQIAEVANQRGFRIKYEAFGDRNYNDDLFLVSRTQKNAILDDPEKVLEHLLEIVKKGVVKTISGEKIPLRADTLCIHGDTPSALKILTYLSKEFPKKGIYLDR